VRAMTSLQPVAAAAAFSAAARAAVCSGLTSVAAIQAAWLATVLSGCTRPVTVSRNPRASRSADESLRVGFSAARKLSAPTQAKADTTTTRMGRRRMDAG